MRRIIAALFLVALAGCSSDDHDGLREWMEQNSQGLRGKITPLPEVKAYEPVAYAVSDVVDPFRPSKIEPDSKFKQGVGRGGQFQPDFEARELRNGVLEKYALESLSMIGRLVVNNRPIAVIKYENNVRQVKVGDYLGLDFGMVTEIGETEVKLKELIQDSAGEWSERQSSLYLQTTEGGGK